MPPPKSSTAVAKAKVGERRDRQTRTRGPGADRGLIRELAQLIGLILTINAWNRIGVTTRLDPES
jgi:hypothetical protein